MFDGATSGPDGGRGPPDDYLAATTLRRQEDDAPRQQDLEDELARRITAPLEALNAHEVAAGPASRRRRVGPGRCARRGPCRGAHRAPKTEEKLRELAALRDAGSYRRDFEAKKTAILATM